MRLALQIGMERLDAAVQLLQIVGEAVDPLGGAAAIRPVEIAHRPVEALDPVIQEVETRHVVLDLVDAL